MTISAAMVTEAMTRAFISEHSPLNPLGALPPGLDERLLAKAYKSTRCQPKRVLLELGIRRYAGSASVRLRLALDDPAARKRLTGGTGRVEPVHQVLYRFVKNHHPHRSIYKRLIEPAEFAPVDQPDIWKLDAEAFAARLVADHRYHSWSDLNVDPESEAEALVLFGLAYGILQPEDASTILHPILSIGTAFQQYFGAGNQTGEGSELSPELAEPKAQTEIQRSHLQDAPDEAEVPEERSDQVPTSPVAKDQADPGNTGLGPWYALLRAAIGARMPSGPLGPDTIPPSALAFALDLTITQLVEHARRCHNPRCSHFPPSLQFYRHMRPEAIRNARAQVHRTLWTHPGHELVKWVRERILQVDRELVNDVLAGRLSGDRLEQVLDAPGPVVLAAVLWASEFKGPDAEVLFRTLVALIEGEPEPKADVERTADENANATPAKAKVRSAIRERDRAVQAVKQAGHDLQQKERALQKVRREFDDLHQKYNQANEELGRVSRRLREIELAYRELRRDAEKATGSAAALRRDLREQQRASSDLEVGRADLALQLATERRTIEHLKLQLAAVPRGPAAVEQFLRDAEDRIDIARTIAAGGDRERAHHEWTLHKKIKSAFLDAYPGYRQPPPTKVRAKTPARLVTLGGSSEVGRSCYLLELGKHRILVDCGIKPSASEDVHPEIERLERLDAVVLTHAHTDHIGWVPALVRRFPEVGIYCSEATAALLPVMLDDSHQHYMRKIVVQRERAKYIANAAPIQEDYDAHEVHAVPSLVIKCMFNEEEGLQFGDASLLFYPAGHILGAASVLIQDLSGRRIFFSGDFSSFPQLTVRAAEWPDDIGTVDLLVLESTYGGRDPHKPLTDSRDELISFIRKTVEGQGSVILASFGLGRAQELLKVVAGAQDAGELPSVPVYVDGMIKRINPIYRKLAPFDLSADRVYEVTGDTDRQEVAAAAQTHPSIIVTTSGMLTGGPVLHYARHLLPDSRHRIVLTGYQDEGAPSRVLKELAVGRRIVTYQDERGDEQKFEAAMPAKEVGLSAHADQPGLLQYAAKLTPRQVALVHGQPLGQEILRHQLLKIHPKAEVICGPTDLTGLP